MLDGHCRTIITLVRKEMPSYSRELKAFPYILIPYCVKAKSSGQTAATAVRYQDGPRRTGLGG